MAFISLAVRRSSASSRRASASRIVLSRIALRLGLGLALAAPLAGCGGKSAPAPAYADLPPAGEAGCNVDDAPATREQCECIGGNLRLDRGDGAVACAAEEQELSRIDTGLEGGICCAPRGS
jgi:hypothetical protein